MARAEDAAWARAKVLREKGKNWDEIARLTKIPVRTLKYRGGKEGWKKGDLARTLHEKKVQSLVTEAEKQGITEARVLEELKGIAFFDMKEIVESYSDGGTVTFKPIEEVNGHNIAAIREKRGKEGESYIDMEPHSKLKALELVGRHLGMFKDKLDLTTGGRSLLDEVLDDL